MINRPETNQENPSLLSNINHHHNNNDQESPRKPLGAGGGTSNSDRLKRDECSEGAVSILLEAYEAKWVLRNRAKLKGQDWDGVSKYSSKSSKTQTQCKNKIESMKKRYRSESSTGGDKSSWPLNPQLDLLLRGCGSAPPRPPPPPAASSPPLVFLVEPSLPPQHSHSQPPPTPPPPPQNMPVGNTDQNSHDSVCDHRATKADGTDVKFPDHISDQNAIEIDSSTPALLYSDKRKLKPEIRDYKRKRQRKENLKIAESIHCLAEVVMGVEKARMGLIKDLEKMRAEAELKRGEMDLKRTEIIANTQLEIAKLFAGICKDVDSSFRIESRIN